VPSDQVDYLLEEFNLIVRVPQATADSDALPRMGSQRIPDDRFHVVTSIKAEQASPHANAMFGELGQSRLDRRGGRLGIPRAWHPIRIKPDDEDAGCSSGAHAWTIRGERTSNQEVLAEHA
jgi:hypothetical protein